MQTSEKRGRSWLVSAMRTARKRWKARQEDGGKERWREREFGTVRWQRCTAAERNAVTADYRVTGGRLAGLMAVRRMRNRIERKDQQQTCEHSAQPLRRSSGEVD